MHHWPAPLRGVRTLYYAECVFYCVLDYAVVPDGMANPQRRRQRHEVVHVVPAKPFYAYFVSLLRSVLNIWIIFFQRRYFYQARLLFDFEVFVFTNAVINTRRQPCCNVWEASRLLEQRE